MLASLITDTLLTPFEATLSRSTRKHAITYLYYDPRPAEYRNCPEYPDHFRRVWINSRNVDIPIWRLF